MGALGYLLDTHTFLWAAQDDLQLSKLARKAMKDKKTRKFVSAVSAYEIMNKYRLGKLPNYSYVIENYFEVLRSLGAYELPINMRHAHFAGEFDWSHRDPFDRLLAAQAFIEKFVLITNDKVFDTLPWLNVTF